MSESTLDQLRYRIDELDGKIQILLNERAACAQQVAEAKQNNDDSVFYRPEREAEILRRENERLREENSSLRAQLDVSLRGQKNERVANG